MLHKRRKKQKKHVGRDGNNIGSDKAHESLTNPYKEISVLPCKGSNRGRGKLEIWGETHRKVYTVRDATVAQEEPVAA